jgi:arylsulfatase A-like enzyme/alpha-L-arabinofuranosidase
MRQLFFLLIIVCMSFWTEAQNRQFFAKEWESRTYNVPAALIPNKLSSTGSADVVISVNADIKTAQVLPTQFGVNTPFRNGSDQLDRTHLYQKAGMGSLRFPAGSGSNLYFWDGNIPSEFEIEINGIDGTKSNGMTPELFAQFKNDAGAEATIVVNYFYARYGKTAEGTRDARVQQAADYAAGFVRKMNVDLGVNVKYWEIGNECYGPWEEGYDVNGSIVTGKEYGEDFCVFAEAMKAVDPTIKVGVVVTREDDEWNSGVLPEVKDHADFLVVHNYFTSVKDATAANVLGSIGQVESVHTTLMNCVEKYTGKARDYYPVALTEFNSRGPVNCTMVNGLFVSQVLGEVIKNGYGMADLWVSEWNWSETDQESKGFLARNDPDQADYTPRQSYMAYHFYEKCFGDQMVEASSNNEKVKVYASTFSSGEIGLVVVNTSDSDQSVSIDVSASSNAADFNKAYWYELYANSINTSPVDKKFYINGETAATTGGGPENFDVVKPYVSEFSGTSVFTVKKNGVSYIVLRSEPRYNVLFIAVDDLKPVLNCYGESQIVSPNIDRLANRGMVFTNAYCQWSVCGPSRASVMTGQTPDGTGIRNLTSLLRAESPELVTLPEYLKNKGYVTAAAGKVFDPRNVDSGHDSFSWSIPYLDPGGYAYPVEYGAFVQGSAYRVTANTATEIGPEGVDDDGYQDGQICLDGLSKLDQFSQNPDQPFFLAVGFKKPHIPFIAPKKYWDLYDRNTLDLAVFQKMATGSPEYAYHSPEPMGYTDIPDPWTYDDVEKGDDILDLEHQRRLIHGYYAAVSYIDAQVGKLLDKLEEKGLAERTVIFLYGDHGYHLGDHNQWGKHTNFEHSVRAPLIISSPGGAIGTVSNPVEFIDIYPTVCDLAGVEVPQSTLQGESLGDALRGKDLTNKTMAVSEYRAGGGSSYSFRTDRYRLTLWFHGSNDRPDLIDWDESRIKTMELYDYETDPLETINLANVSEQAQVVANLKVLAESWWRKQYQFFTTVPQGEVSIPHIEHFEDYSQGTAFQGDFWMHENSIWERVWNSDFVNAFSAAVVDDSYAGGSQALKMDITAKNTTDGGSTFKLRTIDMTAFEGEDYMVSYRARTDATGVGKALIGASPNSEDWHSLGEAYEEYFDTVKLSNGKLFVYFNNKDLPTGSNYKVWIDDLKVSYSSSTNSDVGISQIDKIEARVYPNPVRDLLHVEVGMQVNQLLIYNLNGISVLKSDGKESVVDVTALPAGVYLLEFRGEGMRVVKRFLKL